MIDNFNTIFLKIMKDGLGLVVNWTLQLSSTVCISRTTESRSELSADLTGVNVEWGEFLSVYFRKPFMNVRVLLWVISLRMRFIGQHSIVYANCCSYRAPGRLKSIINISQTKQQWFGNRNVCLLVFHGQREFQI